MDVYDDNLFLLFVNIGFVEVGSVRSLVHRKGEANCIRILE